MTPLTHQLCVLLSAQTR